MQSAMNFCLEHLNGLSSIDKIQLMSFYGTTEGMDDLRELPLLILCFKMEKMCWNI